MEKLKSKLRELKLAGIVKTLESRNRYAIENNVSYIDLIELLIEDEYVNRKANSFNKRLNKSKLNTQKTIDTYQFSYQAELDKKLIMDIASCRFLNEKKNIILMGKPGVGKTHIANAIGLEAIKQGYTVIFLHINDLIDKIYTARVDGTINQVIRELVCCDLLILDELGFKKIPNEFIDVVFELIRKRYENASIIITTNRNFEDWGNIFGDMVLASAIIDRIVHHSFIIKINGDSFRTKNYCNN